MVQFGSADNALRKGAEDELTKLRASNARGLFEGFVQVIQSAEADQADAKVRACLLLKKFYLDGRAEEKELEQLTPADVAQLKQVVRASMDFSQ